jgi:hypothetical protein
MFWGILPDNGLSAPNDGARDLKVKCRQSRSRIECGLLFWKASRSTAGARMGE